MSLSSLGRTMPRTSPSKESWWSSMYLSVPLTAFRMALPLVVAEICIYRELSLHVDELRGCLRHGRIVVALGFEVAQLHGLQNIESLGGVNPEVYRRPWNYLDAAPVFDRAAFGYRGLEEHELLGAAVRHVEGSDGGSRLGAARGSGIVSAAIAEKIETSRKGAYEESGEYRRLSEFHASSFFKRPARYY